MKLIAKIIARPHVMFVDDEREHGHPIIIILQETPGSGRWDFRDDPGCGVRGVDTMKEAEEVTRLKNVVWVPTGVSRA